MCIICRWGIVDCSLSLLTSLEASCYKLLNCLFVCVLHYVTAPYKGPCFIWKKSIIWCPFSGYKRKHLFRMNLMHENTDNISHVRILARLDITPSLRTHGSRNYITQHFHKFSSFDTKNSHFKCSWKLLMPNQYNANLLFISINVSFRETV